MQTPTRMPPPTLHLRLHPPAAAPRHRRGADGHPPSRAAAPPGQPAPAAAPLHQRQRPPPPSPPHQRGPQGQHHVQDPPQAGLWRGAQAGGQRPRARQLGLRDRARWVLAHGCGSERRQQAGGRAGGRVGSQGTGAAHPWRSTPRGRRRNSQRAAAAGGQQPASRMQALVTLPGCSCPPRPPTLTPHPALPPNCSHDLERWRPLDHHPAPACWAPRVQGGGLPRHRRLRHRLGGRQQPHPAGAFGAPSGCPCCAAECLALLAVPSHRRTLRFPPPTHSPTLTHPPA